MQYTSAQANKLLKKLNEEKNLVLSQEQKSSSFNAALGENVESVRPEYSYDETSVRLNELDKMIRKVKHAVNLFNTTGVIPEFDMTVDEMLVYIPQLSIRRERLLQMSVRLPKERSGVLGYGNNAVIDYTYANYDVDKAKDDFQKVSAQLLKAQTALDIFNNTAVMEIDIEYEI